MAKNRRKSIYFKNFIIDIGTNKNLGEPLQLTFLHISPTSSLLAANVAV